MLQFDLGGNLILGVTPESVIHKFNNWLGLWHFHARQWGAFMLHVRHLDFLREILEIIFMIPIYDLFSFENACKSSAQRNLLTCQLVTF
jgi:hypothetical protein